MSSLQSCRVTFECQHLCNSNRNLIVNICPDVSRLYSIINQPPRTSLYSGGFFIGTLWGPVSYLHTFFFFLHSIEAQHFFFFFITLNNIALLILMVIGCNSIYIRTECIKKSNCKWVIWTAKQAKINIIFSSFSCFHL